ncbi:hypothetical protein JYT99_03095 [bacterium AH-315-E09]|nr:hypothetical protein [bacterium AH-315-E09]
MLGSVPGAVGDHRLYGDDERTKEKEPYVETRRLVSQHQMENRELENVRKKIEAFMLKVLKNEEVKILEATKEIKDIGLMEAAIIHWHEENIPVLKLEAERALKPIIKGVNKVAAKRAEVKVWTNEELEKYATEYSQGFANKHSAISALIAHKAITAEDPQESLKLHLSKQTETRPKKISESEASKVVNNTKRATWKKAGVEKLTWRTSGDPCELCASLEGRVVGIDMAFIKAGEEFAVGEEKIVHKRSTLSPPLHLGCDCFIDIG